MLVATDANTAARLERQLTREILRGEHAPGSRLPTVRELAARFDVNQTTVQRAIARLEALGLVVTRQGSGIRVGDPEEVADLSLIGAWLEAYAEEPARASRLLADFLDVRRGVATRLIVQHRGRLLEHLDELLIVAQTLPRSSVDLDALIEADIAFARALLRITGNTMATCVLNTGRRVLHDVPEVAQAMYAAPSTNLRSMAAVLTALGEDISAAELAERVEAELARVDANTVRRFRKLLEERT